MRLPDEGEATQHDDKTGSGAGRVGIAVNLMVEHATKIGVDVEVQIEFSGRFQDHSLILSALQVPDDAFDSCCMGLLWIGGKSGGLTDRKGNVTPGVGRQIKEHSDD